jgi:hypothetical protein
MPVGESDLRAHHACSLLQTGPCPDIRISEAVLPKQTPRHHLNSSSRPDLYVVRQEARASLARQASSSLGGLISHVCRALCCRQDATEGEPCAVEGECTAKRAALPAPFKSNPCSPRAMRQLRECHLILEGDALGRSASRGSLSAAAGLGRRFWADLVLPSPGGQRLDGAQVRVELP